MLDLKTVSKFENLLGRISERCSRREISDLFELTERLISVNRPHDAIACLKLAVFYHPDADILWAKLGDLYMTTGQEAKAFDAYNEYRRVTAEREASGKRGRRLMLGPLTGILTSGAVH